MNNNLTLYSVTATAEGALAKLKKANIPVYNCRKNNSLFLFYAHNNYAKKVFAIFAHPCYNVKVVKYGVEYSFFRLMLNRLGVLVGAALFLAAVFLSQSFVFKIKISGSGSFLEGEVKRIVYAHGVKEFGYYAGIDEPAVLAEIMALPGVTFCTVKKQGAILTVDVQAGESSSESSKRSALLSDVNGEVTKIVAVCGTAVVSVGDRVGPGDCLIAAYTMNGEEKTDCLAVGYAYLACAASVDYFAAEHTEEHEALAMKAADLYADEITERSLSVKQNADGFIYTVNFTYNRILSINLE